MSVAVFETRLDLPSLITGSAARDLGGLLHRIGGRLLVPPKSFIVVGRDGPLFAGELVRAANWAQRVHEKYAATHLVVVNEGFRRAA